MKHRLQGKKTFIKSTLIALKKHCYENSSLLQRVSKNIEHLKIRIIIRYNILYCNL